MECGNKPSLKFYYNWSNGKRRRRIITIMISVIIIIITKVIIIITEGRSLKFKNSFESLIRPWFRFHLDGYRKWNWHIYLTKYLVSLIEKDASK